MVARIAMIEDLERKIDALRKGIDGWCVAIDKLFSQTIYLSLPYGYLSNHRGIHSVDSIA